MTTPNVPIRMEITVELPAPPEQVWDAIATANGISSWFLPTEFEERVGGAVAFHMGEDTSRGHVTVWEPPRRLEYAEPGWAPLSGHPDAEVTPLVSEFLVEAQSGGTCVLRVVSSVFGTGEDWEQEFLDEMKKGWQPFFENLRLYLIEFPGQQVTSMSVDAEITGSGDDVWSTVRTALGANAVGDTIDARGLEAKVERMGTDPDEMLLRVESPVTGFLEVMAYYMGDDTGKTLVRVEGYLFSGDAPEYVERETPAWKAWLDELTVSA